MPVKVLPAASLRTANRLPAGRVMQLASNYLIYFMLSSIGPAIFGREAKFLPALREAAGPRPWLLDRAATLAQAAMLGRPNQRRCAVSDPVTAATPAKSSSTAARA